MLMITGPRQSGKTTALLRLCAADPNGVLVEPTSAMREYVMHHLAPRVLGGGHRNGIVVLTPPDIASGRLDAMGPATELYVDEMQLFTDHALSLMRGRIAVAT